MTSSSGCGGLRPLRTRGRAGTAAKAILIRGWLLLLLPAGCADGPAPFTIGGLEYTAPGFTQWALPDELHEISGLAYYGDGRVLAHDDESAVIYELDYRAGRIIRRFALGNPPRQDDYEGIAVLDGVVWLVTSRGVLLEARDPGEAGEAPFRVHDTTLGRRCEIEGLDADPARRLLLLVCKKAREPALEDTVAVLAWSLDRLQPAPEHDLVIRWEQPDGMKKLHPSGITRSPVSGNLVLVAARQNALVELSAEGAIARVTALGRKRDHPQMEGITFTPAGDLILADEGEHGRGRLSVYAAER